MHAFSFKGFHKTWYLLIETWLYIIIDLNLLCLTIFFMQKHLINVNIYFAALFILV